MSSIWKGTASALRKRKFKYGLNGRVDYTATYEGQLTALQAIQPTPGNYVSAGGVVLPITDVEIDTAVAGPKCTMSITASNQFGGTGGEMDTTYERRWQRVDKDIRIHRAFQTSGTYELDDDDLIDVDAWEKETDTTLKKAWKYNSDDGVEVELNSNSQQLAKRLARGQTTYPIWVPVARKTFAAFSQPNSTALGAIKAPPTQCQAPETTANGTAYIYVMTTDDATRTIGHPWRVEQEWMGFDEVDTLIYTNK